MPLNLAWYMSSDSSHCAEIRMYAHQFTSANACAPNSQSKFSCLSVLSAQLLLQEHEDAQREATVSLLSKSISWVNVRTLTMTMVRDGGDDDDDDETVMG